MNKVLEIKFDCVNWWGYKIYRTKRGTPIVDNGDGYYTLADSSDVDSEPCSKVTVPLKHVNEFSN